MATKPKKQKFIVRVTVHTEGRASKKNVREYVQDSLDMRQDDSVGGKQATVLSAKAGAVDVQ